LGGKVGWVLDHKDKKTERWLEFESQAGCDHGEQAALALPVIWFLLPIILSQTF